mgnify:CR=1 FL=1
MSPSDRERAEGFRESNADTRYLRTVRDENLLRNETAPTETDQTDPQQPTAHGGRGVFTGPLGGGSMPQLSACYFCGTALDDPVQEYPIVPEDLRTEDTDPTTVALCASCHEKLDAIVGELGDALQTESAPDAPLVETPGEAEDVLVDPDPDGEDGAATDAAESPGTDADVTAVPDPRQADERETDSEAEAQGDAEQAPSDPGSTADAADSEPPADDAGTDEADSTERSVVEGKHDMSALEYNKVMRLLQNREFPVDREEIEVVAANAYQVARSDCATVIDVAVDRGLIAEENGQLVKPEDA